MKRRAFLKAAGPLLFAGIPGASAPCFTGCRKTGAPPRATAVLTVFCAASLKKPVEAAAAAASAEAGLHLQLQFGGSGTLLNQLRIAAMGDLFLAADAGALEDARRLGLIRETLSLAQQTPVLAVRTGNPQRLQSLESLFSERVRFGLANPECASIGKTTRRAAGNRWEALRRRATVMKPTVTEIAADLSLGALDAAIVWDSTVTQFKGLEAVRLPELDALPENATAAVLSSCAQPATALQFARYLAAPDKGGPHFTAAGLRHLPGDRWTPKPELLLFSGRRNRAPLETPLRAFAEREGVDVTPVCTGGGILCAPENGMDSHQKPDLPDACYACDLCCLKAVAEIFTDSVLLTETDIGLATPAGNPGQLLTLPDLARPGVRVGLCNAAHGTLGLRTENLLRSTGLGEAIRKNVVVEAPSADFLVDQMRAGALDAVLVDRVHAQAVNADGAPAPEFVPVRHESAKAIQAFAVRRDSPNRQLALRLLEHVKSHRGAFEEAGFRWRGDPPAVHSNRQQLPEGPQPR